MIDMLVLRIPYIDPQVRSRLPGNDLIAFGDHTKIATLPGIKQPARTVEYHKDGDLTVPGLSHPFESQPTHNPGMAKKIKEGSKNFYPGGEIKASPAKVKQGQKVFGTTD
jgi:phage/plasmid replication protein, gene II/X family